MVFQITGPWDVPADLAKAIGKFVVNAAHLEYDLISLWADVEGKSRDDWLRAKRDGYPAPPGLGVKPMGTAWRDLWGALRPTVEPHFEGDELDEFQEQVRKLIEFRNLLAHGAWVPVPSRGELREYNMVWPEPGRVRRSIKAEDVEERTEEVVAVFATLRRLSAAALSPAADT